MTLSTLLGAEETCTQLTPVSSSSMGMRPLGTTVRWVPQGSQLGPRAMGGFQMISGYQAAPLQQRKENDDGMRPPRFPAAPHSSGWGPEASSSAAASEQHDDGMRPPGFPANPSRSMGMAAAQ
ncbi:TPA: hypothetical protein ACH3X1_008466 [Trebouxia sp. C0004]